MTPVAGRREHLRRQRDGLRAQTRVPDVHVLAAMGEPNLAADLDHDVPPADVADVRLPPSGRLPVAGARNAGAVVGLADHADILIFLDVDVIPDRCLVQRYVDGLARCERPTVLCGPVAYLPEGVTDPKEFADHPPHTSRPVPPPGEIVPMTDLDLFWSLSFAVDRETWRRSGGFDEGYDGYGGEDTDFAQQAAAAGVEFAWLGGAVGYHQYHPVSDPPVEHLDDILRNGRRFAERWGRWPMAGWLRAFEAQGLVRRVGAGWERTPSR
ncbi:glycosyltransferase family 2 protein [Jatrophihabitans sp. YIM 134969]